MRYARIALGLAFTTTMALSLSGCVIHPTSYYPQTTSTSYYPAAASSHVTYDMGGSTLFDAGHAVQRYLDQHYPDADLVRIHALMVGTNAKIDQSSAWEFTYRVKVQTPVAVTPVISPTPIPTPTASPSFAAQAVIPSTFKYRLLKFVYTGEGQLLAPEEQDDLGDSLASVDFPQAILLSKAIETALDIGMGVSAPGLEVTLRPTINGGAVYEIDSSVGLKPNYSNYTGPDSVTEPDYSYRGTDYSYASSTKRVQSYSDWGRKRPYASPTPAPTPAPSFVRGKYLIDAYSGAILERPTAL